MSKFAAILTLAAGTLSTTAIAQPTLTSLGGGSAPTSRTHRAA
jgi:hypothetical protein